MRIELEMKEFKSYHACMHIFLHFDLNFQDSHMDVAIVP